MKSMTGYGTAQAKQPHKIQVSIRSVNGRYLETKFHLGREFMELESELKKKLSSKVKRGTVDIYVNVPKSAHSKKQAKVDHQFVKTLLSELKHTGRKYRLKDSDLALRDIMTLPGVLDLEETYVASAAEKTELIRTFDRALSKMLAERSREGASLKKTLSKNYQQLLQLVRQLKGKRKALNKDLEKKLKERLTKKGAANVDPARLGQEMIFYLDRADISEEITRLEEHIKTCQKLLSGGKEVGKRLDFFCQELLREVNTIGSKSGSSNLTRLVVDAKTLVESIREQVQNLE